MTDSTARRVKLVHDDGGCFYGEVEGTATGKCDHALLPWTEHQAMEDVVEAVREARRRLNLPGTYSVDGIFNPSCVALDALDALRGVREEE